jgi:hypothetical protein
MNIGTCEECYKMANASIFRPSKYVQLSGGKIITRSPQNSPYFTEAYA